MRCVEKLPNSLQMFRTENERLLPPPSLVVNSVVSVAVCGQMFSEHLCTLTLMSIKNEK